MNSLVHIDKSCVFRQTFINGEMDVINNPYVKGINNTTLGYCTFKNKTASFLTNSRGFLYSCRQFNFVGSIRFRVRFNVLPTVAGTQNWYDFRNSSGGGTGYIYHNYTNNLLVVSSGTVYQNGVQQNVAVTLGVWYEFVVSGITLNTNRINLNQYYTGNASGGAMDIESFEIFNRSLTALEISLLYKETLYKKPVISNTLLLDLTAENGYIEERTGKTITMSVASGIRVVKDYMTYGIKFPGLSGGAFGLNTNANVLGTGDVTISFWEKISNHKNGSGDYWGYTISDGNLIIVHNSTLNRYGISTNNFTNTIARGTHNKMRVNNAVFLRKANATMDLYQNGAFVSNSTTFNISGSGTLHIGDYPTGARQICGLIYSVKIFSGLLTAEQIANLYNFERIKFGF